MISRIKSYINNLHPKYHTRLYSIIGKIVSKVVPLWNQTLSPLQAHWITPPRIQMEDDGYEGDPIELEQESDDDDEHYEKIQQLMDARNIIQPEPGDFKTPEERQKEFGEKAEKRLQGRYKYPKIRGDPVDLRKDFGKLQIIVKLANIHLTPEKPAYEGGSWHVEGQLNESMQGVSSPSRYSEC